MQVFKLEDLNEKPLRDAAAQLGIETAATAPKADLILAIKTRLAPNSALALLPLSARPQGGKSNEGGWSWVGIATALSALAMLATTVLTVFIASANVESARTAANLYQTELTKVREAAEKAEHDRDEEVKRSWQRLVIFDILTSGMKENWNGLSLPEIRDRYKKAAIESSFAKEVKLGKEDLEDTAIKKHLFELMALQLVFQTLEDRYITERSAVNPRWQSATIELQIGYTISRLLEEREGDPYTLDGLRNAVGTKVAVKPQDFAGVIAELRRLGLVKVEDGKVWSTGNPPKKH